MIDSERMEWSDRVLNDRNTSIRVRNYNKTKEKPNYY